MKSETKTLIFAVCTSSFIMIICCIGAWIIFNNDIKNEYSYYKENCPKFNATAVEPTNELTYPKCFRENEGIVKMYYIQTVNNKLVLIEDKRT